MSTRNRRFFGAVLLATLLVAGLGSYYASTHPDGLEYVADRAGFLDAAEDSPASNGPLAGYTTDGIEDDRVSGGVAGVAGSLLVLAIAGGLFRVLRRRGSVESKATDSGV